MESSEIISRKKSYEDIYKKYADDIYKLSVYLMKDEEKAKDVTQQAFAILYESFDKVDENYLYACLVHEIKKMTNDIMQSKSTKEEVKEHEC